MKNYLSIAQKWADVKSEIFIENERVMPMISAIIEDYKKISNQNIPAESIQTSCKLLFYPFWSGFTYVSEAGWDRVPNPKSHWEWSLNESQQVLIFLKSMHEEELKLLFREWCETHCV